MSYFQILENLEHDEQNILNDVWYIIAAVVISSVNKPNDIQIVYQVISDKIDKMNHLSKEEKNQLFAKIILRLREAILKSFVIIGFPKTINTLQQLANITPDNIKTLLPTKPIRHTDKVLKNMYNTHPDLAQTALNQLYGPILSETSILNAKDTSLITVAGLMIQDIPLQLVGHSHGAIHNGASKDDLMRVEAIVSILADYYQCYSIAKL
ncbi:uncharacterized protein BX663DRAFT_528501 [Cokeromyces recurvatus]|uniref:uncharacterized protein n=1 Tax=Cokeromyces recurvatus TaxID=90255 RepID=UPI0022208353|nr:uncharacterized protein BX663DRAFT_528501 [Cokeromyces recurvatus]KAI7907800.1 hypothetical protein BX663DRAFT_528501 [Cokeromyces recurvatus]